MPWYSSDALNQEADDPELRERLRLFRRLTATQTPTLAKARGVSARRELSKPSRRLVLGVDPPE